jgi:thiol-disulfide isomerase/thioredoxin
MLGLASPFISNPLQQTFKEKPIHLTPLSNRLAPTFIDSIKKERRIIAFLSLGCPHCRIAAKLFHQLQQTQKNASFLLILNGPDDLRNDFFQDTKADNVPHIYYNNDPKGFQAMAGPYVPCIYWVDNGVIKRETNYLELDEKAIRKWFYKNK